MITSMGIRYAKPCTLRGGPSTKLGQRSDSQTQVLHLYWDLPAKIEIVVTVFCYTKMPFGLKNARATYQRLVDSAFKEQRGVNLEAYEDDMVIKSQAEQDIIRDVEQTFSTLRKINMKLNPKKCSFGMEDGKFLGYVVTSEGIRENPEKTKAVMDMPSPRTLKQMQSLNMLKKCSNKKDFRWTEAAEASFLEMKKLVSELPTLTTPKKGKTLMMYLAAADEVVSAMLLMETNGRQIPIHY
ncbi:reverse transcriptase domain-containing protein [Tanacetum coccineum]